MRRLLIAAAAVLFVTGAVLYGAGRASAGVVAVLLACAVLTVLTLLGMLDDGPS